MKVVVRLASALRAFAGGESCLEVDLPAPVTVGAVIDAISVSHPAIGRRVCDEMGTVRRHVNVFVGPDNVRDMDDIDTVVPEGAEVAMMAAVSGG